MNLDNGDSKAYDIFVSILDELEDNENTIRRLYKFFMENCDDFNVFIKIMRSNSKWLTKDEMSMVKKKARDVFDDCLLKELGFDFSDI